MAEIVLLKFLEENKENRGVMANIRTAIIPNRRFQSYQYLIPFRGHEDNHFGETIRTIAGLYCFNNYTHSDNAGNFGASCLNLKIQTKNNVDTKFRSLLNAKNPNAWIISLTRSMFAAGIPVNFNSLYFDLLGWNKDVKERWAVTFWSPRNEDSHE